MSENNSQLRHDGKPLFHFTKANDAIKILATRKFYPSRVLTCNDPFEMDNNPVFIDFRKNKRLVNWYCGKTLPWYCRRHNREDKDALEDYIKSIKLDANGFYLFDKAECFLALMETVRETTWIFCFSRFADVSQSILSWSHYANKHSGVALEFNFLENCPTLHPVSYCSKNLRAGIFSPQEMADVLNSDPSRDDSNAISKKLAEKLTLSKHNDWKYENEWRMISEGKNYLPINDKLVTAIYFGVNIDPQDRSDIIAIVKKDFLNTRLYSTHKNSQCIKLDIKEIT